jgi:uncharacterized protein YkwD
LVAAHNKERAAAKLGPLTPNAKLMAAARVHARDMAEHEFMSHEGSDGSKFNERIERQGYFGLKLGENVAMGQRTVPGVMREWMKSPHHRENILGDFSEIGAARADSEEGVPYWCVDFGLPRPKLDRDEAITGVVEAVNRARAMADKPPLKVNPKLAKAAQEVAQDLAMRGKLGDVEPAPDERVRQVGYRFRALGEAAAMGQSSPDDVVRTWLESDTHRENFLGNFSEIGVGFATSDKGVPFWSVFLGQPDR